MKTSMATVMSLLRSSASLPSRPGTGRRFPQSRSDANVPEARADLEIIRNRFAAVPAAAAGHGHARGAVDAATRKIDQALAVR
jgi:hypothetical protein